MIGSVEGFKTWAAEMGYDYIRFSDSSLTSGLLSSSAKLEAICNRKLEADANDSVYTLFGNNQEVLELRECISITSIVENTRTLVRLQDYAELPYADAPFWGIRRWEPGNIWNAESIITVTSKLGYLTTIPPEIIEAVYIIAASMNVASENDRIQSTSVQGVSVTLRDQAPDQRVHDLVSMHIRYF